MFDSPMTFPIYYRFLYILQLNFQLFHNQKIIIYHQIKQTIGQIVGPLAPHSPLAFADAGTNRMKHIFGLLLEGDYKMRADYYTQLFADNLIFLRTPAHHFERKKEKRTVVFDFWSLLGVLNILQHHRMYFKLLANLLQQLFIIYPHNIQPRNCRLIFKLLEFRNSIALPFLILGSIKMKQLVLRFDMGLCIKEAAR